MDETTDPTLPKFEFKEVVFAKIRGYVPWPAIIDGVRGNPGNRKYDVFFYGTYQLGVCKEEDLKPYMDNRATLGRPKNHIKSFNKAVQEADDVLGLVCQNDLVEFGNESDSSEKVGKKRDRSRSQSKTRSQSRASPATLEPPAKRGRSRERSLSETREESREVLKRGRGRPRYRNKSMPRIGPESSLVEKRASQSSALSPKTNSPDGSQPTIKQGRGRPRSLTRPLSVDDAKSDTAKPNLKALQCVINPDVDSVREKREAFQFLRNEVALNEAVFGIQGSLSLMEKPDIESAMKHIDEFFILDLSPLLLKKHPDAVETFENLQYYCGNFEKWSLSDSAKSAFQREIKKINAKARVIYDKFKQVFNVPKGEQFEDFFKVEVERFKRATQGIPLKTIWKMTKDPVLL